MFDHSKAVCRKVMMNKDENKNAIRNIHREYWRANCLPKREVSRWFYV